MTTGAVMTNVRPLDLGDLDSIFLIDHKIRNMGKAITYEYLTTEHIFTINRKANRMMQPTNYVDLITGDVSELLNYGFVAEVEGHVRGFILGRAATSRGTTIPVGEVLILGVHPLYWQKGIATLLVNAISEKFRSNGIKKMAIEIDVHDKQLMGFCEHMGFNASQRIDYVKTL
jgi:GNAT superfamily N-acetyltransferase